MSESVRVSGPIFDGRADVEVHRFLEDARKEVAQQGYADVMTNLNTSIRHPTPYYETQVRAHPTGESWTVDDRGIIYGPWLEGTGSRNRTTRFKGYFSFRRAAQALQAKASSIAENVLARHIGGMR